MINKLNDKIIFLSAKNNEYLVFVEKVYNKIEEILQKNGIRCDHSFKEEKEKIFAMLADLEEIFMMNRGNLKVLYKDNTDVNRLKQKLVKNSVVVKEFEDARSKLLQHFVETPKKNEFIQPLTSRF